MMRLIALHAFSKRKKADTLIVPFWEGSSPLNATDQKSLTDGFAFEDFHGKEGETLCIYPSKGPERRILLVGLGKKEKIELDSIRRAYGSAIASLHHKKSSSITVLLPQHSIGKQEILRAVCEGVLLGNYAYIKLKNETLKKRPYYFVQRAHIVGMTKEDLPIAAKARKLISAVYFARDLVNENADDKPPQYMADLSLSLAKKFPSLTTTVLDKKKLDKFGLILAVSKGAATEPKLVVISHKGDPQDTDHIVLVGKGVVYDTGGLSLKPTDNMATMKSDMGGSATVLGTIAACAMLGVKKNVTAIIPFVENSIGSKSYKLGDVYKSYSGKMVEITNTDAEGRLVLADAISYALDKHKPTHMLDFATLTGGVVVALGEEIIGYYTQDENMHTHLEEAAKKTGELIWQLPLHLPYHKLLKSDVADIKNSGARSAHSIQGALFLEAFMEKKIPWIHLDIAGPAFLDKRIGYHPQFGTGIGVRLAISFLEEIL